MRSVTKVSGFVKTNLIVKAQNRSKALPADLCLYKICRDIRDYYENVSYYGAEKSGFGKHQRLTADKDN